MVPLASIFDFNAEKILKVLAALKQCRCFFLRHYSWGTMRTRDSAECRNGETPCLTFDAFDHSFFGWGTTGTMAHLWTKWHLVGLLATNPKFASRCSSCGRASVDVLCPVLNVFFILLFILFMPWSSKTLAKARGSVGGALGLGSPDAQETADELSQECSFPSLNFCKIQGIQHDFDWQMFQTRLNESEELYQHIWKFISKAATLICVQQVMLWVVETPMSVLQLQVWANFTSIHRHSLTYLLVWYFSSDFATAFWNLARQKHATRSEGLCSTSVASCKAESWAIGVNMFR